MTGLSLLALGLSAYLGWHHLMGGSVVGCSGGSACDQVLSSRWSSIGGVLPVSGLAAGAYLAIVMASLFIGPRTEAADRRLAWSALLVLVGAAAGSAVWFTILQKWVIGSFCPYCMATHMTGLVLAALVLWRAPQQVDDGSRDAVSSASAPEPDVAAAAAAAAAPGTPAATVATTPAARRLIRPWGAIARMLVGVVLAGALVVCQIAFAPPAVYRAGEAQVVEMPKLDPHAVPLVGSPDAPYVVTLLFDYKCPHCQKLHDMLEEAIGRYDGKLAFALCPAPLNPQCNPYIARDVVQFKDSCELAKLGLAVWVANREAFAEFDRWMFTPEEGDFWHPRTLDAAKEKAVELVGQQKLDAAWAAPWIDAYMQTCIRIYGDTGGTAVPKLVFGQRWVTPEPEDTDDLLLVLRHSLGLPRLDQ